MKIVIDIDDEDYKRIQDIPNVFNSLTSRIYLAIRNGTPLEPKTGHWIKSKDGYMRCDQCGSRGSAIKARFCHHCGAKM